MRAKIKQGENKEKQLKNERDDATEERNVIEKQEKTTKQKIKDGRQRSFFK